MIPDFGAVLFDKKALKLAVFLGALLAFFAGYRLASASTNVTSTTCCHWAWNDTIGWMDFYNTQTITVSSQNLTGYASSSAEDISLDCHTTRNGNICTTSNYQVTNDGLGNLSGWGWNDDYGWISFDCHNNGGCASSTYETYINANTGDFYGWAWNDTIGWFSFNCDQTAAGGSNTCSTSNYKVNSSWIATSTSGTLDSSTYDTGVSAGAQLNSVIWQGNLPANTSVKFQFAVSNSSSGPWTFVGSDGTSNTYYTPTGPGSSLPLSYSYHNNFRYFRYRTSLFSNQAQRISPRVDDVIVNWSP